MTDHPVTDVLDSLAEAETFYRAGDIKQASYSAATAAYLATILPGRPPVDGSVVDRTALLRILDRRRPDQLPERSFAAARDHMSRAEWTASAVALNDLAGLLVRLSHRMPGEVAT